MQGAKISPLQDDSKAKITLFTEEKFVVPSLRFSKIGTTRHYVFMGNRGERRTRKFRKRVSLRNSWTPLGHWGPLRPLTVP